jgi:hypothetical protein
MTETDDDVRWALFRQPHRRWWTYETLGELVFERRQFEATFAEVNLPTPAPRPWPGPFESLPQGAELSSIELAGWGYGDRMDVADVVMARMDLRRGDHAPPGVSQIALTFATALCGALGTTPRQQLKGYIDLLLSSGRTPEREAERAKAVQTWYLASFAPSWLRAAGAEPPDRLEGWPTVRNVMRDRLPLLNKTGERSIGIRRMPSSTGWDGPPGEELLHLVDQGVEGATGIEPETSRVVWSACWYAAVLAKGGPNGDRVVSSTGATVAESALELLRVLVRP